MRELKEHFQQCLHCGGRDFTCFGAAWVEVPGTTCTDSDEKHARRYHEDCRRHAIPVRWHWKKEKVDTCPRCAEYGLYERKPVGIFNSEYICFRCITALHKVRCGCDAWKAPPPDEHTSVWWIVLGVTVNQNVPNGGCYRSSPMSYNKAKKKQEKMQTIIPELLFSLIRVMVRPKENLNK